MVTGQESEANLVTEDSLEAAQALKSEYCRYLDGKDWARWSALSTDDAVMQVGPNAASAVVGREPIRRLLSPSLPKRSTSAAPAT